MNTTVNNIYKESGTIFVGLAEYIISELYCINLVFFKSNYCTT